MNTAATAVLGAVPAAETSDRQKIRAIVGSSSGNLVEWFDFYAYAFTALYFSSSFFPAFSGSTRRRSSSTRPPCSRSAS